jgi:hypothetical protein
VRYKASMSCLSDWWPARDWTTPEDRLGGFPESVRARLPADARSTHTPPPRQPVTVIDRHQSSIGFFGWPPVDSCFWKRKLHRRLTALGPQVHARRGSPKNPQGQGFIAPSSTNASQSTHITSFSLMVPLPAKGGAAERSPILAPRW